MVSLHSCSGTAVPARSNQRPTKGRRSARRSYGGYGWHGRPRPATSSGANPPIIYALWICHLSFKTSWMCFQIRSFLVSGLCSTFRMRRCLAALGCSLCVGIVALCDEACVPSNYCSWRVVCDWQVELCFCCPHWYDCERYNNKKHFQRELARGIPLFFFAQYFRAGGHFKLD